jgi:hypothetical protein
VDATGFETFVHRDYAELFASVPAMAVGSIAAFMLKDRLSGEAVPKPRRPAQPAESAGPIESALFESALFESTQPGGGRATLTGTLDEALNSWIGAEFSLLRPDEELALVGVMLAAMAEGIERDPLAYPLLACAAARLIPEAAEPAAAETAGRRGWTGLTERARRAAVEVLRPLALSTLVRAATWELVEQARP